jgi:hypothetical protein
VPSEEAKCLSKGYVKIRIFVEKYGYESACDKSVTVDFAGLGLNERHFTRTGYHFAVAGEFRLQEPVV